MGLRGVGGEEVEVQGKGLTRESLGCAVPTPLPLIPSGPFPRLVPAPSTLGSLSTGICARVSPGSESRSLAWGLGQSWSPRGV